MSTQTSPKPLTARQQFALDQIRAHQPITSDALGALWCQHRSKHGADERCDWDGSTGRELGRALRRRGLAIERRKLGGWCTPDHTPGLANSPLQTASDSTDPQGFPKGF